MTQDTKEPRIFGGKGDHDRPAFQALWRGMKKNCPRCDEARLFQGYTKVRETCPNCGLDLTGQQADDAPPYFTMLISGHLVIPLALEMKRHFHWPLGIQFLVWGLLLTLMIWFLLPVTKGGLIGIQWANRMHGFSDTPEEKPDPAAP